MTKDNDRTPSTYQQTQYKVYTQVMNYYDTGGERFILSKMTVKILQLKFSRNISYTNQ